MLSRRLAVAFGLLVAALASQLPEFTQQYRQRLGGAIDELTAQVAQFDAEASAQSLSRAQGIARLAANGDPLARGRGEAVAVMAARQERLIRQRTALSSTGPVAAYVVLAEDFDAGIAREAAADYQPAVPTTPAGLGTAAVGFVIGWLAARLLAMPMRRRRAPVPAHR